MILARRRLSAFVQGGEDFVAPSDLQDVAHDVLRHRIILKYEAAADGITPDRFIDELLGRIPVP